MDVKDRKYYHAYEDRYRSVYKQGVRYWSDFPWEVQADIEGFERLLEIFSEQLGAEGRFRVLEPGCGEGHLAVEFLARGFDYVGIDLAPSALAKAEARVEALRAGSVEAGKASLLCHDVTDLSFLEPESFDLAVDNRLLHILVVDGDRSRYLDGLRRVLKPRALILFNEVYRENAYEGSIETFEDYMREFTPDLVNEEERTAYNDGKPVSVMITQIPARPRDKQGYIRELSEHGFEVMEFLILGSYLGCRFISRAI